jgi:hypothetical protein
MGIIHLVVDRLLVEDVVEDWTELEDPSQVQTSIAAKIATLICFLEQEMMLLRRKKILEVEVISPVGGIISPTGVVLEMVEIVPQIIWRIMCHWRMRIWPSKGQDRDIQDETVGKVIMAGGVAGVMRNLIMRMMSIGMTMRIMDMIMMVMGMKNLMMKTWMIEIRGKNRKVRKGKKQRIGLDVSTRKIWIGKMMRKMRIWRGMGNMEMRGMEIGKIGVWTEQVPPTALNKRRQEITNNPSLGGGEEAEEAGEEGEGGKEREGEDGGVIDPHLGEGEVTEETEEVEEEGEGVALD